MRKQIKISEVLTDLDAGLTRVKIAEKYDISAREVKALFDHPKLKGKKAKKGVALSFTIEDDTDETLTSAAEAIIGEPDVQDADQGVDQGVDKPAFE